MKGGPWVTQTLQWSSFNSSKTHKQSTSEVLKMLLGCMGRTHSRLYSIHIMWPWSSLEAILEVIYTFSVMVTNDQERYRERKWITLHCSRVKCYLINQSITIFCSSAISRLYSLNFIIYNTLPTLLYTTNNTENKYTSMIAFSFIYTNKSKEQDLLYEHKALNCSFISFRCKDLKILFLFRRNQNEKDPFLIADCYECLQ